MEDLYDVFVKYKDEKEERVIARCISSAEMWTLTNFLLRERKRHFSDNSPKTHYPEYIRIK